MLAIKLEFGNSTIGGSWKKLDNYNHDDIGLNYFDIATKKMRKECVGIPAITLSPARIAMRKGTKACGEKKRGRCTIFKKKRYFCCTYCNNYLCMRN